MPQYRIDTRDYAIGEIIECNPDSYYDAANFDDSKRAIEDMLNENRRNSIPNRNQCLFIFAELYDAVRFWIKMRNSSIYEVKRCQDTLLYHRGDMNITDFMHYTTDQDLWQMLAQQYWQPIFTFKPCIEILVNKVEVVRTITIGKTQRKAAFAEYCQSNLIENLTFYQNHIPR